MEQADSTAATISDSAAQCLSSPTAGQQETGAQPIEGSQPGAAGSAPVGAEARPAPGTGSTAAADSGEAGAPPAGAQAGADKAASAAPSSTKRKVVVYVAYIGAGYSGMQVNPGVETIEGVLEAAMHRAGGISNDNAGSFLKVKWMRCARTDKGVSAVGQVVSLKLILLPDIVQKINAQLPKTIRVLGYTRVTNSFDARIQCDKRRYEYILPQFAFDAAFGTGADVNAAPNTEAATPNSGGEAAREPAGTGQSSIISAETFGAFFNTWKSTRLRGPGPSRAYVDAASSFVFDNACHSKLNDVLKAYEGTHNFHNFTPRMQATDSTANRYILQFTCPGPFTIQGEPWVRLVVTGQSFMLHQIRKMVGLAVAVMRGAAPPDAVPMALDPRRDVNTPIAPDVGLFLDEGIFEAYNSRWGNDRDSRVSLEPYAAEVSRFKEEQLYPQIAARDRAEQCTAAFLEHLKKNAPVFATWASLPLNALPSAAGSKKKRAGGEQKPEGSKYTRGGPKGSQPLPDRWTRIEMQQQKHAAETPASTAAGSQSVSAAHNKIGSNIVAAASEKAGIEPT